MKTMIDFKAGELILVDPGAAVVLNKSFLRNKITV